MTIVSPPGAASRGIRCLLGLLVVLCHVLPSAAAQLSTATLAGTVVDSTAAVLPGAELTLVLVDTSVQRRVTSTPDGSFVFTALSPGRYRLRTSLSGFSSTQIDDLVLTVGDRISVRVELAPAARGETVTVSGQAHRLSTAPALSTVIDRHLIENMPLNGRSLQSLFELTAGAVITPARSTSEGGQFSVNGQRTNANYFTLDGVSANAGMSSGDLINGYPGQSGSGQLPSMTALGGTNGLVSVDALQEFRIHTSGYAPEFGRTPGGQVSLVTRSGSNAFTGSAFEYYRNEVLDANSWFLNRAGIPKPELSQHNAGGVLGGPVLRSRSFFFFSYEGLRLLQPKAFSGVMPTVAARQAAAPGLRVFLDALPLPNGPDRGNGSAEYTAGYSDESRFDATSIRSDNAINPRLNVFARVSYTPSYASVRSVSSVGYSYSDATNVTLGSTLILSKAAVHDLRINYSSNSAPQIYQPDDFGGAVVPPVGAAFFREGRGPDNSLFQFALSGVGSMFWGRPSSNQQRQFNIVDTVTLTSRSHEWKAGLDFRRSNPRFGGEDTGADTLTLSLANLSRGVGTYSLRSRNPEDLAVAFDNLSLFAQDTWRVTPRLTATYGVRWEYVPPPHTTEGGEALTFENLDDPYGGQVHFAPRGTPLWGKRYDNLAPRVGVSYVLSDREGRQSVLKGSWGRFYDLGFGQVANAYRTYPYLLSRAYSGLSVGAGTEALAAIPLPTLAEVPSQFFVMDRELRLPSTYQWNVSVDRALGSSQTLTVAYVGAEGRDLLKLDRYTIPLGEWPTSPRPVNVNRNRGHSDYRALQVQFQRRLHGSWQSQVSYTLGRSRDTSSSDIATNVPAERLSPEADYGYSDFDVRHSMAAAVTWQIPAPERRAAWTAPIRDWSVDVMFRARSGFPVDIRATVAYPPDTESARPNVVPGQPFWIDDSSVPGGRRLNIGAFTAPAPETQGDLRRGVVRGFSARQVDMALRREIRVRGRARLQLRLEMFNLFNMPNFGDPPGSIDQPAFFGVSRSTLATSLGGLNAMYQLGGPRSTQLAVKILF
jgi:hypothetical protein